MAVRETLQNLKLLDSLATKIVQGVDIGQTYQFVARNVIKDFGYEVN